VRRRIRANALGIAGCDRYVAAGRARVIDAPYTLHLGDCMDVLKTIEDASVDSIVTDPPYELGFMGKGWDKSGIANNVEMWSEALRVLKPGGHLLAFSGSRTYHRMVCAIEDAGFEVRDRVRFECSPETKYGALWDSMNDEQRGALLELLNDQIGFGSEMAWTYASGFPKSLDVSKAIDKAAGAERVVVGVREDFAARSNKKRVGVSWTDGTVADGSFSNPDQVGQITAPATDAARQWSGCGTALKPAHEPICVARKPLVGTVASNVLQHGVGALNIDACRVGYLDEADRESATPQGRCTSHDSTSIGAKPNVGQSFDRIEFDRPETKGRWPANVIHDGSKEVRQAFPDAPGQLARASSSRKNQNVYGAMARGSGGAEPRDADVKSAARFFYCAKSSRADRNEGCDALPDRAGGMNSNTSGQHITRRDGWQPEPVKNNHPTVKPTDLMAYLCRLVTPPGGLVLDPFMGSGSTGKAAMREGFRFIGIDMTPEYIDIARARIKFEFDRVERARTEAARQPDMFPEVA
jgi:site-specific DNA-methyltransferase (adenine-specific)